MTQVEMFQISANHNIISNYNSINNPSQSDKEHKLAVIYKITHKEQSIFVDLVQ